MMRRRKAACRAAGVHEDMGDDEAVDALVRWLERRGLSVGFDWATNTVSVAGAVRGKVVALIAEQGCSLVDALEQAVGGILERSEVFG